MASKPDKRLQGLIDLADGLENSIQRALERDSDAKELKEIASALKDAVAIRRNLLDIPTQSERESQRMARAKFRADHEGGGGSGAAEITVKFSDIDYAE